MTAQSSYNDNLKISNRINNITFESKKDTKYSEFEIEFNALVRKHFPHWEAKEIF